MGVEIPVRPVAEREAPWTTPVDTLLRWRRFLAAGIALSWLVVAGLALFGPQSYRCEALVGLSAALDAFNPAGPKDSPAVGISIATYKKVERRLMDERVLSSAFQGKLSPRAIDAMSRDMGSHVAPVSTAGRDEVSRLTHDDSVVGLCYLSYQYREGRRKENNESAGRRFRTQPDRAS